MRIVCRSYVPDGRGTVEMIPEKEEDLWTAYNLINAGDTVTTLSQKKIKREPKDKDSSKPGRGSYSTTRVTLNLEIRVEKKDYYKDKDTSYLRIKGKNVLHTEHVRVGAYHNLEIDLNHPFVLWKPVWDSASLEACKPSSDTYRVSIEPGSDTDQVSINPSSDNDRVSNGGANTKLARECEQALKKFFTMLRKDSRAIYGPEDVQAADELLAVQTLLITDDLFRSSDVNARQKYANLVKSVKDSKGDVCILPADHASCKRLKKLTGVAAILRFPLSHSEDI